MQSSPGRTVGEAEGGWAVTEMAREALTNMQEQYEQIRQDMSADAQQKLALRERRLQNAEVRANQAVARLQVCRRVRRPSLGLRAVRATFGCKTVLPLRSTVSRRRRSCG